MGARSVTLNLAICTCAVTFAKYVCLYLNVINPMNWVMLLCKHSHLFVIFATLEK